MRPSKLCIVLALAAGTAAASLKDVLTASGLVKFPDLAGLSPKLTSLFSSDQSITVFAPGNSAADSQLASGSPLPASATFWEYHVVPERITTDDLSGSPRYVATAAEVVLPDQHGSEGQMVGLARRGEVDVVLSGGKKTSVITALGIPFDNGVLHIVDQPLTLPPTLSSLAEVADIGAFMAALDAANLTATLQDTPRMTMFAPSDAAMSAGAAAFPPQPDGDAALLHHALAGRVLYGVDLAGSAAGEEEEASLSMMAGPSVAVARGDGHICVGGAMIADEDYIVANGVVHIIDRILAIPPAASSAQPPEVTAADKPGGPDAASPSASASSGGSPTTAPSTPSAGANNERARKSNSLALLGTAIFLGLVGGVVILAGLWCCLVKGGRPHQAIPLQGRVGQAGCA